MKISQKLAEMNLRFLYSQIIFITVIVPENYLPRNYQALKSIQKRTQSYDSVGF